MHNFEIFHKYTFKKSVYIRMNVKQMDLDLNLDEKLVKVLI